MSPAIGQPSAEADHRPQWRRDIAPGDVECRHRLLPVARDAD